MSSLTFCAVFVLAEVLLLNSVHNGRLVKLLAVILENSRSVSKKAVDHLQRLLHRVFSASQVVMISGISNFLLSSEQY